MIIWADANPKRSQQQLLQTQLVPLSNLEKIMRVKMVKDEDKKSITKALGVMSVLDFRPFNTCRGVGFQHYSQCLIDIAARHGIGPLIRFF